MQPNGRSQRNDKKKFCRPLKHQPTLPPARKMVKRAISPLRSYPPRLRTCCSWSFPGLPPVFREACSNPW